MPYELAAISFALGIGVFTLFYSFLQPRVREAIDKRNIEIKERLRDQLQASLGKIRKASVKDTPSIVDELLGSLRSLSDKLSDLKALRQARNACFVLFIGAGVEFSVQDAGQNSAVIINPWILLGFGILITVALFLSLSKLENELD